MECEGEVEVYFMQDWRRVLLDSWSESEASVFCRQLGCGSVFSFSSSSTSSPEHSHMCVMGFNCSGSEAHLGNCSSAQAVNCSSREQLSITCLEFKEFRLTEGCQGNLEVFYNGTWGNVCVNDMDEETASLICQELNCGRSGSLSQDKARVQSAPNWLDDLKCRKHDSTLWQCPSSPWGQNNCDNSDDVAQITCSDLSVSSTVTSKVTTITITAGQTEKGAVIPPQTPLSAVSIIYPVSLLVLGVLLFLALGLLFVLFYRNRVLMRVLSKRRQKTLPEAVYEEIDQRLLSKRKTQRGSILSEEQHSGYEDVDEKLLSAKAVNEEEAEYYDDASTSGLKSEMGTENTPESYDDVMTAGQTPDRFAKNKAEVYDDAISAGENPHITTVYTPESYDDVITPGQDLRGAADYDDVGGI
ncbi:hypothetical protein SRHO_G00002640 [Serrasalmus rhombeus]